MTRTPERYLLALRLRNAARRADRLTVSCRVCGRKHDPQRSPLACSSSCCEALRHRDANA